MSPPLPSREELIESGVGSMEPIRRQCFKLQLLVCVSGLLGGGAVLAWLTWEQQPILCGLLAAGGAAWGYYLCCRIGAQEEILRGHFDEWRQRALASIEPQAKMLPQYCVSRDYFDESLLNADPYSIFQGHNYVSVGPIECSSLDVRHRYTVTYYVTVTDAQGRTHQEQRTREEEVTVFRGLFLVLPMPTPLAGTVQLTSKRAPHNVPGLQKISVASPFLNRAYQIVASHPFIGHRVLTPSVMLALERFSKRLNRGVPRFSFHNQMLYIAVPGTALRFGSAPSTLKPVTAAKLQKVFDQCHESISFLKMTAQEIQPT